MTSSRVAVALCASLLSLALASTASATFPGGNGKIVYSDLVMNEGNNRIAVVDPADGTRTFLTDTCCDGINDSDPQWSADGNRIAFASNRVGNWELYVMDADGSGLERLTETAADERHPSWSPDGTELAFESTRHGDREISVMSLDGGSERRVTTSPGFDGEPEWAPDGSRILFTTARGGDYELYTARPDGTDSRRLATGRAGSWAPDGSSVVFYGVGDESDPACGAESIYLVNADGGSLRRLTCIGGWMFVPTYSPDGTMIAFASDYDLMLIGVDGTGLRTTQGNADAAYPDWQPLVAPRNDAVPQVSGTPALGEVLEASRGDWWGTAPIAYTYAWERCTTVDGTGCTAIPDATGPSYAVGAEDAGHALRVRVRAANDVGAVPAASLPTQLVPHASDDRLLVSASADRSDPVPLGGTTLGGDVHVFTPAEPGVARVRFYLDDPTRAGRPRLTETKAPYDFDGTAADNTANPFDLYGIAAGSHTITAAVELKTGGTTVLQGTFRVDHAPRLAFDRPAVSLVAAEESGPVTGIAQLDAGDGSRATFTLADDADWLTVSADSPTTLAVLTFMADPAGLAPGNHDATVSVSADGYVSARLSVSLTVTSGDGCPFISPLDCSQVLVRAPYRLDFGGDAGGVTDGAGVGTGLRMIDPSSQGGGYRPENLTVDASAGTLRIVTTAGIAAGSVDSQANALGVGIAGSEQVSVMSTTLRDIPAGTGRYEQAGLWLGTDEDNHVKLVVRSDPNGTTVQYLLEDDGAQRNSLVSAPIDVAGHRLTLELRADPATSRVTGAWSLDGEAPVRLGVLRVPAGFLSPDAAAVDPAVGTGTFGGILASHRNAQSPLTYRFDDFSVTAEG